MALALSAATSAQRADGVHVGALVLLELSPRLGHGLDLLLFGGSDLGGDETGHREDQQEAEGEEQEPPRGQAAHQEEPEPELGVEHEDVAVIEQRVYGAEGEERRHPPEVEREDGDASLFRAQELQREPEAEQNGEQGPRLGLAEDAHEGEGQPVDGGVPGDRVGAEAIHVHQQHAEQGEAADHVDLDDARLRGHRPRDRLTQPKPPREKR